MSTRIVPDVFDGYTEVHAYREEDGLFQRDEKLSKLNFSPGYAGTPTITPDGVYTVMPEITRMIPERRSGMIRDAIRESVKGP